MPSGTHISSNKNASIKSQTRFHNHRSNKIIYNCKTHLFCKSNGNKVVYTIAKRLVHIKLTNRLKKKNT